MNEEEKFKPLPSEEIDFDSLTYEQFQKVDKLNFLGIAEGIINDDIIQRTPPFIYGVYGKWGSGKTWMMRALQKCLEQRKPKKYKTVWFDPWVYEHADKGQLFLGLLKRIEKEINVTDKALTNLGIKMGAATRAAAQLVLDIGFAKLGTSWWNAKKFYQESLEAFGEAQINQVDSIEEDRRRLCDKINKLIKTNHNLAIFVDDLDRCLPDHAILLLDQLKNYLTLPRTRIVTILGIDNTVFSRMLNVHYGYGDDHVPPKQSEPEFGQRYLEKIIHKPYCLGSGPIADLLQTHLSNIKWLKWPLEFSRLAGDCWPKWKQDFNPRKIDRKARDLALIMGNKKFLSLADSFYEKVTSNQDTIGSPWRRYSRTIHYRFIDPTTNYRDGEEFPPDNFPAEVHYFILALFVWCVLLSDKKTTELNGDVQSKFNSFPGPPNIAGAFSSVIVPQIYEAFQNLLGR